jgi:hypothetical protein
MKKNKLFWGKTPFCVHLAFEASLGGVEAWGFMTLRGGLLQAQEII